MELPFLARNGERRNEGRKKRKQSNTINDGQHVCWSNFGFSCRGGLSARGTSRVGPGSVQGAGSAWAARAATRVG
jgi:hypothetical protein